jgi:ketosteroid isomerase-like protein
MNKSCGKRYQGITTLNIPRARTRIGRKKEGLAGHRMTVYRKQRDGRWLLSRDVHTLSAVA